MSGTAEIQADALDVLAHPDPDPELLPALPVDTALALQAETAGHLCRAILRQETGVEALTVAMKKDMAAWAAVIARAEEKSDNWRAILLAWMQRTGTTQLKTPWFTASQKKGRRDVVVDDEVACLALLKTLKADAAWESKERIIKKEFDVVFNSIPERFAEKKHDTTGEVTVPRIAHEEIGEPTLVIRRKEMGT